MFLRCNKRKKDGKVHRYYSVVENRRVAHGRVVQKPVLYLGEITDDQQKAWRKSLEVFDVDQNRSVQKYLFAIDEGQTCDDIDAIPVKLSGMVLSNPRDFGDCWLGCEIWGQLVLARFWAQRIDTRQRTVPFSKVLKLLTINRLIKPGAEFYVHRHWFDQTATGEKTTLTDLINKIEKQYGKAQRVWLMDRGIPTEQSLSLMRETGVEYLVGTPRK